MPIRDALEQQFVFQADLVLEFLELEVCIVVQIVHSAQLLFKGLHLLEELAEFWRVRLRQLLELCLHVVVHFLLETVQVGTSCVLHLLSQPVVNF